MFCVLLSAARCLSEHLLLFVSPVFYYDKPNYKTLRGNAGGQVAVFVMLMV